MSSVGAGESIDESEEIVQANVGRTAPEPVAR
jgi:hypothetical protein